MNKRVVLDTNVLVSGLAHHLSPPGILYDAWQRGDFSLVCSPLILKELARAADRLKVDPEAKRAAIETILELSIMVHPFLIDDEIVPVEDRAVLGTAIAGAADVFVTGDKALLRLKQYARIPIMSPRVFLEDIKSEADRAKGNGGLAEW